MNIVDSALFEQLFGDSDDSPSGRSDREMALREVTDQFNGFRKRVTKFIEEVFWDALICTPEYSLHSGLVPASHLGDWGTQERSLSARFHRPCLQAEYTGRARRKRDGHAWGVERLRVSSVESSGDGVNGGRAAYNVAGAGPEKIAIWLTRAAEALCRHPRASRKLMLAFVAAMFPALRPCEPRDRHATIS